MTKVEVTVTERRTKTVDITFPVYREHDVSGDNYEAIIYSRVDADGNTYSVHKGTSYASGRHDFQIVIERTSFNGATDYLLGQGIYELSEAEFYEAVEEAKAFLDLIPRPQ